MRFPGVRSADPEHGKKAFTEEVSGFSGRDSQVEVTLKRKFQRKS